MSDHNAARVVPFGSNQILDAEDFVNHAGTGPQDHPATGHFHQIPPQVLVGHKQYLTILRNPLNDLSRIAARDRSSHKDSSRLLLC